MYEKIKSWISNNRFLVGMGVGAVLFLACYLFSRAGIHDNGKRAGDTGTKLNQAIGNQQEISAGITDSKGTADAIGSSIERSQTANKSAAEAVDRAGSLVEEAGRIAAENLEILATVRARVLREIGAKIDIDQYATGISYGVSRRIGSKYIGFRGEYDWQDKKTGVWVTYAY